MKNRNNISTFPLSEIMDLRHQSSAMCIIMLVGENTHPWSATKVGNPIPATIPVPKLNNQQTTQTCHYRSRPVEVSLKLQWYRDLKESAICSKFLRTHLCRSLFLEHRTPCRSEEPLKSVTSKNCQLVDWCANDRAFYRDAWWKFHCSCLRNPVLPRPVEKVCIVYKIAELLNLRASTSVAVVAGLHKDLALI